MFYLGGPSEWRLTEEGLDPLQGQIGPGFLGHDRGHDSSLAQKGQDLSGCQACKHMVTIGLDGHGDAFGFDCGDGPDGLDRLGAP